MRIAGTIAIAAAILLVPAAAFGAFAPAPANTAAPQIQGPSPPQDGLTYTTKPGQWDGPPGMTIARQWLRCNAAAAGCGAIPGATGTSYVLGAADAGARIRVRETARCAVTTPTCQPVTSDSAPTATVLPDPHNEAAPQVSGLAQVGQLLSASLGFWRSPAPLSFSYQWIRCDASGTTCSNIPATGGPDYRILPADTGATLRVVITARNSRPRSATAVSAQTPVVAAPPPAKKKAPRKRLRLLSPFPRIVIAGLITRGTARLTEFTVRGPRGALVRVRCRGRGCPLRARRFVMRRRRVRVHWLERTWRAGPLLEVTVTRRGFIGKFSRFRFRAGAVPKRRDLCIAPGAAKPRRCPRR